MRLGFFFSENAAIKAASYIATIIGGFAPVSDDAFTYEKVKDGKKERLTVKRIQEKSTLWEIEHEVIEY